MSSHRSIPTIDFQLKPLRVKRVGQFPNQQEEDASGVLQTTLKSVSCRYAVAYMHIRKTISCKCAKPYLVDTLRRICIYAKPYLVEQYGIPTGYGLVGLLIRLGLGGKLLAVLGVESYGIQCLCLGFMAFGW